MRKNFLNISGKIESIELAALEEIANIAASEDIPFFLVGAKARDLIFFKGHNINTNRATLDIDVGVKVPDWIQYNKLKERLVCTGEFKEDKEFLRLIFQNKLKVDLVPFGPIADKSGKIRWPHDDEIIMLIIGFEEAFAHSQTLRLRDNPILEIKAVTLAGLAVIKIISWDDRYPNRKKDAIDLAFIMRHYTAAGNIERIYNEHPDLLDLESSDFVDTGVRLLGRDIAKILTPDIKDRVLEILDKETINQEKSKLIIDMYTSNVFIEPDFNRLLGLLNELKRGILERL
ncbi:MAG: nucleotidyl transferase AbiEii/AbiGii toxin family protein [Acidobacteriota bacterium]